jgi:hypothetical protein
MMPLLTVLKCSSKSLSPLAINDAGSHNRDGQFLKEAFADFFGLEFGFAVKGLRGLAVRFHQSGGRLMARVLAAAP